MTAFDELKSLFDANRLSEGWLLMTKIDVNTQLDTGFTPTLILSMYCRDLHYYELALKESADFRAQTDREFVPLCMAALRNDVEAMAWLIDHGCDPNWCGSNGITALHFAAEDEVSIAFLLGRGARARGVRDDQEVAPIHWACA
jgi:hypothetical protein